MRYVRPTASITPRYDPAHTGSVLSLGAVLDVSRGGHHVATLLPSEGFYDSGDPTQGSVGHFIGGTAVSHISMDAGLRRDVWSAIAPNIGTPALKHVIDVGNRTIPLVRPDEGVLAVAVMARAYMQHPPPASFRLIVSPLVTWIWIGGAIVLAGGLIALWPTALRRRATLRARTRLGAELEAAREAKYRELRDLELDDRTGKLSDADYHATDHAVRVEALAILDRLEELDRVEEAAREEGKEKDPRGGPVVAA
jgi:cytochrome c-type biogenesis protein CcmF